MATQAVKFEKDIHLRIMQLCVIANMTPRQLSVKAGMDPGYINTTIRLHHKPIRRSLHRLCKAADVSLREFLEVDKYE